MVYLQQVQERFRVTFPGSFLDFCRRYEEADIGAVFPGFRRGAFVVDLPTFEAINKQIGAEEWGDYERIIVGAERPKDGGRLWGGLIPFYYDEPKGKRRRNAPLAESIYGFPYDQPMGEKVLVWSVHTIVHGYATFDDWLNEHG